MMQFIVDESHVHKPNAMFELLVPDVSKGGIPKVSNEYPELIRFVSLGNIR
jgi:hypothetical protein